MVSSLPTNVRFYLQYPVVFPAAPTNLDADANNTTVTLTWLDPTLDTFGDPVSITNVQVWLGVPGVGTLLGTVLPGVQTYVHTNAPLGNQTYYVRAFHTPYFGDAAHTSVMVGDLSYINNFDVDNGGWVAEPTTGWQWGAPTNGSGPTAHSEPNVWGTGLTANYPNSACFSMTLSLGLPIVSAEAVVHFWGWYITEGDFSPL